jgi:hypothetical protein
MLASIREEAFWVVFGRNNSCKKAIEKPEEVGSDVVYRDAKISKQCGKVKRR